MSTLNSRITGATGAGTRSYFDRFPSRPGRLFPKTGWSVSSIGFGTYRVDAQNPMHREALDLALHSGCNLIDTSPNYQDGHAELCIGEVLSKAFAKNTLTRDQLVIITKAGYIQGAELPIARERESRGQGLPEVLQLAPECWHCIAPESLALQITGSLSRLRLETIDLLLLHNPEQYLHSGGTHAEYYQRIRRAFAHLEQEVHSGRIQAYGVSSNTLIEPKDSPGFTSLEILLEMAQEVSTGHHFAAIQLPFNLYEPGAATEPNCSGQTTLQKARDSGIAVLSNRPLNAYSPDPAQPGKIVRLSQATHPMPESREIILPRFQEALTDLLQLEAAYADNDWVPAGQICWGHVIRRQLPLLSVEGWTRALANRIRPAIERSLTTLSEDPELLPWVDEYRFRSEELFQLIPKLLELENGELTNFLTAKLNEKAPELERTPELSLKALRVYLSFPGIQTVLLGMRNPKYVKEALNSSLDPLQTKTALRVLNELKMS